MKYEIMLKILFELMSKKCVKASYLAEKYEVSVRSIHRYISCLEMAGVPIYTIRGNNGGFAIVDTFKFSSTFMTEKEFEQTINTLSAITESVPNKDLTSVINKLKSIVRNKYSSHNITSGNLIIDAGPWGARWDAGAHRNMRSGQYAIQVVRQHKSTGFEAKG